MNILKIITAFTFSFGLFRSNIFLFGIIFGDLLYFSLSPRAASAPWCRTGPTLPGSKSIWRKQVVSDPEPWLVRSWLSGRCGGSDDVG